MTASQYEPGEKINQGKIDTGIAQICFPKLCESGGKRLVNRDACLDVQGLGFLIDKWV